MRIVATSDFHGYLPDIPECDLLLIGGDVCPVDDHDRKYQADWLRGEFSDWMRKQPAKITMWCGGNHDFVLEDMKRDPHTGRSNLQLPGVYLCNEQVGFYPEMMNAEWPRDRELKIWASPMSNTYGRWAFMTEEDQLQQLWKTIPRDIDILMVHGPIYGYGDFIPALSWSAQKHGWVDRIQGEHVGSTSLRTQLEYEEWPNLKLVVTGHIHEAYGRYSLKDTIEVVNASHVDGRYNPVNPPVEIEL